MPIPEAQATTQLQNSPLGIGEHHDKPGGRNLAIQLLKDGVVKRLFVEVPHTWGQPLIDENKLGALGDASTNPISLKDLITTAKDNRIPVHAVDDPIMVAQRGERNFPRRHKTIRDKINSITNGNLTGCLLLWGAAHFEGKDALSNYFPNLRLDWVKMG